MNNHSGAFPGDGSLLPYARGSTLPAHTGLTDVAFPAAEGAQHRFNFTEVWRIISKWWWLIAAIIICCLLAAVVVSLMIEPEYRAKATLELNPEGVQVMQMEELQPLQMGDREFITTQAGLLRSRALAERVARSLNLAENEDLVDLSAEREEREARAADALEQSVAVSPVSDSRLIELTVESADPVLAARIANSYADNFIQSSLERRYEATAYARRFLEERLATIRARLEESERQLVAYAKRQGIVTLNVDSGDGSNRTEQSIDVASLTSLNDSLSQARSDRIAAEQRFRQSQVNGATTEVLSNPTVQALTGQRAELQAEYQEKLGLFQPEYPQMEQLRSRIQALTQAIQRETQKVSGALRSEYAAAAARERALQGQVNALKAALLNLRERSIQYTILQREVDTNRSLYDALLQRYKEVGVAGGVGASIVSVVDRAKVPTEPFKPNLPLNIAIGLFVGTLLGFGLAFALEWMDDTIKTPDDLTSKLGISPLGVIPSAGKGGEIRDQLQDSRSQVSEAYQSVRAALQFTTEHGVPKVLLITSTRAAEGKSSTALALAQSIANLGASVLLIDSDLRKPTFRGPDGDSEGLSSLLAGSSAVEQCIHPTDHKHLSLLSSGPIPPNPAELLASGRMEQILKRVSAMFDYIVVDGPPVLGLADAPLLSSYCEGTLMVIEAGAIRRTAALNAVNRLRSAGARMMGGILTKFNATKSGYGYGYGYGYGDDDYSYRQGEDQKKQIHLLKNT